MEAERLSSRKNPVIVRLRALAADAALRRAEGEYICDGDKLLREALEKGAAVTSVLWKGRAQDLPGLEDVRQYVVPEDLFDYASPMKNSPGPLFTLRIPPEEREPCFDRALLLENVQDPGNVGTLIRTAAAMGVDAVLLCGACADVYSPKTARATMGAVFRERLVHTDAAGAKALCEKNALPLYGAALSERASDIRVLDLRRAVVAIGSEGHGLSAELLALCDGELIIPMTQGSESLNAASAGTIVLWEMTRDR
ncbi:MAG: RNA methyltransferase [Oscillospiraceae bacterium]|nr:RNA methyltransferase [Oscillospiraceae bacterium]